MKRLFIKVMRDLFQDKFRSAMSLLAIIIGTTAFGSILFSYNIINRELVNVFTATNPSSANIVVDKVDDKLIALTEEFKGISDFEEKAFYELRMKTGRDQWKTLHLFAVKDFNKVKINKISSLAGDFQPGKNEILIERDALGVADTALDDTLSILLPNSQLHKFKVVGIVNDISLHPASIHNTVYAYVSYDTLAELGLQGNRLDFLISGNKFDRQNILAIGNNFIKLLEKNGYKLKSIEVSKTPGLSIHMDEYKGALFIFQVFSIISFLFGSMIMSSLLSTILSNQVRQIGILKAIGCRTEKILSAYMLVLLFLVIITIAISFPLSIIISKNLSIFFMRLGNMQISDTSISKSLYLLFCTLGLFIPLIIAFLPIRKGLNITVKEALNNYGIHPTKMNRSIIRSQSNMLKVFSRPVLLSLKNAVNHRERFFMNIATLTLGGAMFVAVVTSMISIQSTLSDNLDTLKFDYQIHTSTNVDDIKLAQAVKSIPEIKKYENWGISSGKLKYRDGKTGNLYPIIAPSYDTKMITPEILEGRWMKEGDNNEIVVGHKFYVSEPDYKLGDIVTFQIGNIEQPFRIVGTIKELGSSTLYLNKKSFDRFIPDEYKQNSIKLLTQSENPNKKDLYYDIEGRFKEYEISVFQSESRIDQYRILMGHFMTTLISFLVVAIMLVVVAAFGLTSTMSVQVSERTKEIGIMKAIGASGKQITNIVTAESIFIGIISWFVSIAVGIPTAILGAYVLGNIIIETPLNINFTSFVAPYIIWLILTIAVGYVSSRTAAKRASKLSIKETLAFE